MNREEARIALLGSLFGPAGDSVAVGIGDDAAVLAPSPRAQALSVDVAVEGVHFRRGWLTWPELGARAFMAAASDLAAMGAVPRAALLSLIVPNDFPEGDFRALAEGLAQAARDAHMPIVGGNLSSGGEISITTTVLGELDGTPLTRSGAQPGDTLYVTGTVGSAALGLALLERGSEDGAPIDVWRKPRAALETGARLRGCASAAIDISDGLAEDLVRLCRASAVGAEVHVAHLPLEPGYEAQARELGLDPVRLALTGGEDYQVLFTCPAETNAQELGTRIGHITAKDRGVQFLDAENQPIVLDRTGHQHFG